MLEGEISGIHYLLVTLGHQAFEVSLAEEAFSDEFVEETFDGVFAGFFCALFSGLVESLIIAQ